MTTEEDNRGARVIDTMDQGFLFLDADFIIRQANPAAERMAERPASELLGALFWDAWPGAEQHPLGVAIKAALAEGRIISLELPRARPGKATWFDIDCCPADGGIALFYRNIDERKQASATLGEREEQLRLAIDSADVGEWDVDVPSGTMYWPARVKAMFGISADRPVTLADYYEGLHPDDRERTLSSFANAADPALRSQYDAEYRTIGKEDQVVRWVAARGRGIFDASGTCIRMIGTAIDVTARKAVEEALRSSEERLRQADRTKDEFLAMLAHELRNPLAPIRAAADLLQIARLDEQRVRQTSQIIARQVTHMTALVDDLLDVSRVTSGLVVLDATELDIHQVVADAVEQAAPFIRARRHALSTQLAPGSSRVVGDRKRLVQVIANLLNNAAKFTPEGGNIAVRSTVDAAHVVIEVVDDGAGMSAELMQRAFDLFAQSERTPDRSSGGLGLGLALVRNIVELHGGTVACASAGPGLGSVFTVSMPRLADTGASAVDAADAAAGDSQSRPVGIMLVDDNVDAAAMLALLLEATGHRVVVAHDARSALALATTAAPQVFLLDIGLPEMDGNELARRLRARPDTAGAVMIAITGYGQDSDRVQTAASGFDHHLVKPVDFTALSALLESVTPVAPAPD